MLFSHSVTSNFGTPWTVAHQASLSMNFFFQARILEWAVISSSRKSSWPRNRTHIFCVSCISKQILYHWFTWEAYVYVYVYMYAYYIYSISSFPKIGEEEIQKLKKKK